MLPSWVYRKVPLLLRVTVPLKGFVTLTAVIGSPSGSESFAKTEVEPLEVIVAVPDSTTNTVSPTPLAGLLIKIVTVVVFPGKNPSVGL